jgi:soluble lytic murein transglycosylase
MKVHNGLLLSTVFLMVLLCFTFISVKPTRVAHREVITKEEAVSQIIPVTPTSVAQGEKVTKKEAVRRVTAYIRDENVELKGKELRIISEMVYKESKRYKIDYRLVLALMKIESNFRCEAVSRKGARGLLQVNPSLARHISEDAGIKWRGAKTLHEPETNIRIGVHFFSRLIGDFQNTNMALHAYHVGPTRLREILTKNEIPRNHYLNLVLDEYDRNISLLPPPQYPDWG